MSNILVFVEQRNGQIKKASFESLSAGRKLAGKLGGSLSAVLIGTDLEKIATDLKEYGPEKIFLVDSPDLSSYSPDAYRYALMKVIKESDSKIIMAAHTSMSTDLLPGVAAALNAGMVTDAIQITTENKKVRVKKPIFAGKLFAEYGFNSEILFITLRPNNFEAAKSPGDGKIVKLDFDYPKSAFKATVVEVVKSEEELDVSEADRIISGGRGLKGTEGFGILRDFAGVINAAIGASRSAVDSGWIGHQHQVGQTGKTVTPVLYIACGISGKIQHLAGMSSSRYIVAVNKDPEAPIFKVTDFGIIGDLFKVIPAATKELKKIKG